MALTLIAASGCSPETLPTPGRTDAVTAPGGRVISSEGAGFDLEKTLRRSGGIALDDHRIALIDRQGNRVVVVDTSGEVSLRVGEKGWGEGQFINPAFIMRADSGFAVFDGLRTVFVRFDTRGRPRKDTPQFDAIGIPSWGMLTGIAQLSDGSWVYSTSGSPAPSVTQQALYHRSNGVTRLIAATPAAPNRQLRFDCGARLAGESPVFWPSLHWAATGNQIVYAATADDRVVTWDSRTGDSTVMLGEGPSRESSDESALAVTEPFSIQTTSQRCSMTKEDVVKQRGMAETMPAIQSIAVAPDGTVWVALTTLPTEPSFIRVHDKAGTDTIIGGTFPHAFLTPTRFLAEQKDTTGQTTITLWEFRRTP